MQGTVRWFDARIGYGFIISPEEPELQDSEGKPKDIFVHYTKIQMEGFRKLEPSEEVSYDLVWNSEGQPQAENVKRKEKN